MWLASRNSEALMMTVQHVVEVVRDAAGELADRLHLAGLVHVVACSLRSAVVSSA